MQRLPRQKELGHFKRISNARSNGATFNCSYLSLPPVLRFLKHIIKFLIMLSISQSSLSKLLLFLFSLTFCSASAVSFSLLKNTYLLFYVSGCILDLTSYGQSGLYLTSSSRFHTYSSPKLLHDKIYFESLLIRATFRRIRFRGLESR